MPLRETRHISLLKSDQASSDGWYAGAGRAVVANLSSIGDAAWSRGSMHSPRDARPATRHREGRSPRQASRRCSPSVPVGVGRGFSRRARRRELLLRWSKREFRWFYVVQTLSAAVALRGSDAKVFGTRNPGTSDASRTRSSLYWHRSIAASPWPAAFQAPNGSVQEKSLLRTESLKIIREWN
jgi:hypothetical protein